MTIEAKVRVTQLQVKESAASRNWKRPGTDAPYKPPKEPALLTL